MTADQTELTITPEGMQAINRMRDRVIEVRNWIGCESAEYCSMLANLNNVFFDLFRLGGRVTPEGDLGLYVVSFIHYGVVWTPQHQPDSLIGEWSIHS